MKSHWKTIVPALMLGAAGIAVAPAAQAQSCGLQYDSGSDRPDKQAAFVANGMTCDQAHAVFNDWRAGKGSPVILSNGLPARDSSIVDGFTCYGNSGGAYSQTGVLTWCDKGSAHLELRDP